MQTEYYDYTYWLKGVARTIISMSDMKCHVKIMSSRVLTKSIKVLECEQHKRYAVHNLWHFVFKYFLRLCLLQDLNLANTFSCWFYRRKSNDKCMSNSGVIQLLSLVFSMWTYYSMSTIFYNWKTTYKSFLMCSGRISVLSLAPFTTNMLRCCRLGTEKEA